MKNRILILTVCACFIMQITNGQDIIVTKDSKSIHAKVTEINVDDVKYQNFDHQDGPLYTLPKSNILTIVYQNGQVETFDSENQTQASQTQKQPATASSQTQIEGSGDGTSENPFRIATAEQLAQLAQDVNDGNDYTSIHFVLIADIDLSTYGTDWNGGKGWIPIGHSNDARFLGNFDGAGHKISNLFIDHNGYDNTGLFGYVFGGKVKNFRIVDAMVSGGKYTGSVAGTVGFNGGVMNCYTTGKVKSDGDGAGGVAGMVRGAPMGTVRGTVFNSYSACEVSGNDGVGGVAGIVMSGSVVNCHADGAVSGKNRIGGIAGSIIEGNYASVSTSYATGSVTGERYVGGVAGYIRGGSMGNISFYSIHSCVALNPDVSGNRDVARIVAAISGASLRDVWANANQYVTAGGNPKTKLANRAGGLDGVDMPAGSDRIESWWSDGIFKGGWGTTDTAPWQWDSEHSRPVLYWQL